MNKGIENIARLSIRLALAILFVVGGLSTARAQSVRKERRAINAGNELYGEGKYAEAIREYKSALEINGGSNVAKFNLGLTQIRMSDRSGKQEKDSLSSALFSQGTQLLEEVAAIGDKNADLSSKANYNLGNLQFEKEDYGAAIRYYKQALRLNPSFENARRNLRIAQLRQQNQQDDKNDDKQDKNQNQDQNKDQDQNQDQNKDQDQNRDQEQKQDQQNQQQDEPKENEIHPEAARQILNAVENKEAQTRARQGNNKGEKAVGAGGMQRRW